MKVWHHGEVSGQLQDSAVLHPGKQPEVATGQEAQYVQTRPGNREKKNILSLPEIEARPSVRRYTDWAIRHLDEGRWNTIKTVLDLRFSRR
jgi:hypothetical protein